MKKHIKTTLITGALGAGKTTIILNLVQQLDPSEQVMWLKNEYGEINVDSELAKSSIVQTSEIMNGCLCCVLVGKLHNALVEIVEKYEIDRLIIETAGTAHPYPILSEIKSVKELELDGVVKIIDCKNFDTLEDKSYVAREQAKLFNLIVLNKSELVSSEELNRVEDEVFDLYLEIPKYASLKGFVPIELLLGYDSSANINLKSNITRHTEHFESFGFETNENLDIKTLKLFLEKLDSTKFIRVKGLIRTKEGNYLLNYVLGQIDFQEFANNLTKSVVTFIGKDIANLEKATILDLKTNCFERDR